MYMSAKEAFFLISYMNMTYWRLSENTQKCSKTFQRIYISCEYLPMQRTEILRLTIFYAMPLFDVWIFQNLRRNRFDSLLVWTLCGEHWTSQSISYNSGTPRINPFKELEALSK